jgi:ligand-binding SRPBCC domain-containing protein
VFKYLTDPAKLDEQLKPHIKVQWQNPGIELQTEAECLFLMTRFGVEQKVRYRVEKFVLGNQLVYRQTEGFFSEWTHSIKFEDHGLNETLVTDLVDYDLPFGLIGKVMDDLWVRSDLKKMLKSRLNKAKNLFTKQDPAFLGHPASP